MANSALIDDLLKQFAENPRRVFARLANEYRKRGELDAAIEICRSHVPLQPGYISGHIVLGQALFDSGSLDEARGTFETALALDPENLIALRHMGDIARASGDVHGAREWYRRLLEIDAQNEEVAAQLDSLGASEGAEASGADATAEANVLGGWGEVTPEAIDVTVDENAGAASAATYGEEMGGASEAAATADHIAADDLTDDALVLEEIFDVAESVEAEAAEEEPPVAAIEGFETTSFEAGGGPAADPAAETDAPSVEPLELEDVEVEATGSSEEPEEAGEAAYAAESVPEVSAIAPLFPADAPHLEIDGTSPDDADSFATETMAELYLQQGFPDRALAIYRELAARDPGNASLEERIAELTTAEEAPPVPAVERATRTAREFFGVLSYRRAPRSAAADVRSEDELEALAEPDSETQATEPAAMERDAEPDRVELSTDSEMAPVESRNGKPGKEAESALSLDDVFRDSPATEGAGSRNGLSFDEFFARRTNGGGGNAGGSVAVEAEKRPSEEGQSSDDEPQDLELFHAWLDGLKG